MPTRATPAPVPIDADSQAAGLLRAQTSFAERPAKRNPTPQPRAAPPTVAPEVQVVAERSSQPSHIREVLREAEAQRVVDEALPAELSSAEPEPEAAFVMPAELEAEVATTSVVEIDEFAETREGPSIRLASLLRGLAGGVVDAALVTTCALLATVAMRPEAFAWLDAPDSLGGVEDPFWWVGPVTSFAVAATVFSTLYHAWFLPSLSATLGQRIVGARVVTFAQGQRPARLRSAFRGAFAALGCLGCGVGPLWAIWIDSHRRSLGDRFAGTVLVTSASVKENHVG